MDHISHHLSNMVLRVKERIEKVHHCSCMNHLDKHTYFCCHLIVDSSCRANKVEMQHRSGKVLKEVGVLHLYVYLTTSQFCTHIFLRCCSVTIYFYRTCRW